MRSTNHLMSPKRGNHLPPLLIKPFEDSVKEKPMSERTSNQIYLKIYEEIRRSKIDEEIEKGFGVSDFKLSKYSFLNFHEQLCLNRFKAKETIFVPSLVKSKASTIDLNFIQNEKYEKRLISAFEIEDNLLKKQLQKPQIEDNPIIATNLNFPKATQRKTYRHEIKSQLKIEVDENSLNNRIRETLIRYNKEKYYNKLFTGKLSIPASLFKLIANIEKTQFKEKIKTSRIDMNKYMFKDIYGKPKKEELFKFQLYKQKLEADLKEYDKKPKKINQPISKCISEKTIKAKVQSRPQRNTSLKVFRRRKKSIDMSRYNSTGVFLKNLKSSLDYQQ